MSDLTLSYQQMTTAYLYTGNPEYSKPVQIISYKNLDIAPLLDILLPHMESQMCYSNARNVALAIPAVEYVEGQAVSFIPLGHAWNYYKGFYFDLTWEKHHSINDAYYYETVRGTIDQLETWGFSFNSSLDLLTQWLNKPEIRAEIELNPNSIVNLCKQKNQP